MLQTNFSQAVSSVVSMGSLLNAASLVDLERGAFSLPRDWTTDLALEIKRVQMLVHFSFVLLHLERTKMLKPLLRRPLLQCELSRVTVEGTIRFAEDIGIKQIAAGILCCVGSQHSMIDHSKVDLPRAKVTIQRHYVAETKR
jgi:hypothetical protein